MIQRLVSIFSCIPTALFASSAACFLACASVASAADYARGLAASIGVDSAFRAGLVAAGANARFALSYER